jgi:hypothetical protein
MRSALLRGLQIEREIGVNPYQFGVIGSTDAHTGWQPQRKTIFTVSLRPIPRRRES